jgi:putative membrane protein
MLQLTSSGGTYPVQTSPGFFAAIHPYLPMSYVVDGLRHLIDGGSIGTVIQGCLVLAGFAAGGFALTTLAAHRARVLRPRVLHPELTL